MRRLLLPALALGLLVSALPALAADAPADDEPKVLALVFAADWCGACKVLDPKLQAVKPGLADLPVELVMLDLTDADARAASAATARRGGYSAVYDAHAGKTGFVLLVDASSKEVLDRIVHTDTEAEMRQKVRRAIARA